jgi:hypothetical protein
MKLLKLLLPSSVMLSVLTLPLAAAAATHAVTGGTNGPLCNSGGYFTPSSITIASGDTITFSVPSNDPYSGGLQIHGFPEGNFTVLPGGSHTTTALIANVNYYGTWPSSGCMKGSGSATVNAPAATPAPGTPAPTQAATTAGTSKTTTPTPTPAPSPSKSASPSPSANSSPSPGASSSPSASSAPVTANAHKNGPSLFLAASTGALGLGAIAAAVALGLWVKGRLAKPPGQDIVS